MFGKLFGKSTTSKADVVFAIAGAIVAVYKAVDTYNDYKNTEEISK